MDGINKEEIQNKVLEVTKDSLFNKNEQERAEKVIKKTRQWISKIKLNKMNVKYWNKISKELRLKIER
jgi:hypothetical protein